MYLIGIHPHARNSLSSMDVDKSSEVRALGTAEERTIICLAL